MEGISLDDSTPDLGPSPLNWIGVIIPAVLSFPWELFIGSASQAYIFGRFVGLFFLFLVPTIAAMIARRTRRFRAVWGLVFGLGWLATIILTIILVLLLVPVAFRVPSR